MGLKWNGLAGNLAGNPARQQDIKSMPAVVTPLCHLASSFMAPDFLASKYELYHICGWSRLAVLIKAGLADWTPSGSQPMPTGPVAVSTTAIHSTASSVVQREIDACSLPVGLATSGTHSKGGSSILRSTWGNGSKT